jgi:predicted transcriptional regulator
MKWNPKIANHYRGLIQTSEEGTTRAFKYYYIKRAQGYYLGYTVGRYTFGKEIDYRETFGTLKEARAFCEEVDRETLIIEAV